MTACRHILTTAKAPATFGALLGLAFPVNKGAKLAEVP